MFVPKGSPAADFRVTGLPGKPSAATAGKIAQGRKNDSSSFFLQQMHRFTPRTIQACCGLL
jgi:hypothetical protein